jgi:2-methylisocitrate lyase-like PEP mutase family enzyme
MALAQRRKTCADTVRIACATGLVGGSIEDATGNAAHPIYELPHAVERIQAAAEAVRGLPVVLTARADNFQWDKPDLDDTLRRLQAFSAAGAHVLYAPALPNLDAIRTVCTSVDKPVNVIMGLTPRSIQLPNSPTQGFVESALAVFARAALGALMRAAEEVISASTFNYAASALTEAQISPLMSQQRPADRVMARRR